MFAPAGSRHQVGRPLRKEQTAQQEKRAEPHLPVVPAHPTPEGSGPAQHQLDALARQVGLHSSQRRTGRQRPRCRQRHRQSDR
eukprot:6115770-Pyramimonas_sp.AAC.1